MLSAPPNFFWSHSPMVFTKMFWKKNYGTLSVVSLGEESKHSHVVASRFWLWINEFLVYDSSTPPVSNHEISQKIFGRSRTVAVAFDYDSTRDSFERILY